jgi:hypothetical protein
VVRGFLRGELRERAVQEAAEMPVRLEPQILVVVVVVERLQMQRVLRVVLVLSLLLTHQLMLHCLQLVVV